MSVSPASSRAHRLRRCSRVIEFPASASLGTFDVRPEGVPWSLDLEVRGLACGPVVVPAGMHAALSVSDRDVAAGLGALATLPADALDVVSFLHAPRTTDAEVALLDVMTGIRMLDLYGTQVTDAAATTISTLVLLEWLSTTGTAITDTGVARLAGLARLERLSLKHTRVTDSAAGTLARLPSLRWLSLAGTAFTARGLEALAGASALAELSVTGCSLSTAARTAFTARRPDVLLIRH